MVQLGAVLYGCDRQVRAELNLIVNPEGKFTIPKEASDIHGITQEIAAAHGLALPTVLRCFGGLVRQADIIVAHNFPFDDKIMKIAIHRISETSPALVPLGELIASKPSFCTMKKSTDICKLPGKYGYKWPNLQEAHTHFLGKPFDGAHDAMADVRACGSIYWAMHPETVAAPVEAAA
jgi:DNA polymerase III epsilon subunit-like protein